MIAQETVPCKFCNTPTDMVGTKLCDPCWEVDSRLRRFLQSTEGRMHVIRELLAAYEADARPAI